MAVTPSKAMLRSAVRSHHRCHPSPHRTRGSLGLADLLLLTSADPLVTFCNVENFFYISECARSAVTVNRGAPIPMARPALSASRSIEIIDLLAAFPGRAFTLSEIARAARINVASCHAVLNALMERGYLVSGAKPRTYVLGPALVAVGQAALKSQTLVGRAQQAAQELLRELDQPTLLSALIGDEVVGVLSMRNSAGREPDLRAGERVPMVPPAGAPFIAWSSPQGIDAWIAKKQHLTRAMEQQIRQSLALTRKRGYQVTLRLPESAELAALMTEMAARREVHAYKEEVFNLLNSIQRLPLTPEKIAAKERYDVILIAAPIFNERGEAAYSLCLSNFAERLSGAEIQKHADHVLRASLKVMRADLALRA